MSAFFNEICRIRSVMTRLYGKMLNPSNEAMAFSWNEAFVPRESRVWASNSTWRRIACRCGGAWKRGPHICRPAKIIRLSTPSLIGRPVLRSLGRKKSDTFHAWISVKARFERTGHHVCGPQKTVGTERIISGATAKEHRLRFVNHLNVVLPILDR